MTKNAPAVIRSRKRFLAYCCSHGAHYSKEAFRQLAILHREYKPDVTLHLGDVLDTTAFRSGARGTADESASSAQDTDGAMESVQQAPPSIFMLGNHDWRLYKLLNHPSDIVREAAENVIRRLNDLIKTCHAEKVDYGSFRTGWRRLGNSDLICGHGWIYNENAARDTAEAMGESCLFGHTHRLGMQPARTRSGVNGYNVGCMCEIDEMDYASARRATLGWRCGCYIGEYGEGWHQCHPVDFRLCNEAKIESFRTA